MKKRYENISIYDFSYKTTFMGSIPLYIRFNETDEFFKMFDGIRYLALFSYSYDEICNRIKYLKNKKSGITDSINQKSELIHIIIYLL